MNLVKINQIDDMDFQRKESYKTLRTNIGFIGNNVKVITITSCIPGEGKSNVAMNLAISLAEAEKKVLLIDADMRKSTMEKRYDIQNIKNYLAHYLAGQCQIDEVINETNVEMLHMILAGTIPPNPSELLMSENFNSLLENARINYDYVIIDCPPLGSVVDAAIAGKKSDGVLLVVSAENVSYKLGQKIQKQLEITGCRILGVVLNKVKMKGNGYYKKYYGKYYIKED